MPDEDNDSVRERVLHEVESGRLTVAEVLDIALATESGRSAIAYRVAELSTEPQRRPRVSERQTLPPTSIEPLLAAARTHFASHPDVVSVGWGVLRSGA